MTEMHDSGQDERLDRALRSLPPGVEPTRDLWPRIEARLERTEAHAPAQASRRAWAWQAAAAVLLVAGTALLTATLVQRSRDASLAQSPPPAAVQGVRAMPAVFGPAHAPNSEYDAARRQLSATLQQKMAQMPPAARQKLEANLAEMQRAAAEINAALDRQPGDPLLEELLLNTYHDELAMFAVVNQLTSTSSAGTPADAKRMQL
jgi:hypothetical protein